MGRIQTRSYENGEGKRIFVTEVVAEQVTFLEPKKDKEQQQQYNSKKESDPFANSGQIDISDSDLPF